MIDKDRNPSTSKQLCRLDHITVLAPILAAGRVHVQELLGVSPDAGGAHPSMGTHNLLLRLGDSHFLEVLAIDPDALPPPRPRWFGRDNLPRNFEPFLGAWVVQAADIDALMASSTEPWASPRRSLAGS